MEKSQIKTKAFTGHILNDGIKAYETDIVKEWFPRAELETGGFFWYAEIKFHNDQWMLFELGFDYSNSEDNPVPLLEMINNVSMAGNIHDNPMMLN